MDKFVVKRLRVDPANTDSESAFASDGRRVVAILVVLLLFLPCCYGAPLSMTNGTNNTNTKAKLGRDNYNEQHLLSAERKRSSCISCITSCITCC